MRQLYGITEDQYVSAYEQQRGMCAICSTVLTTETLVDHDHSTGKVRGLLCRPCNFALGLFKDNPELLVKAAKYIRQR